MIPLPSTHPAQAPRRFLTETSLIFAAWTVYGLLLASQLQVQAAWFGRSAPWYIFIRSGLLDAYLWAFSTIAIFWLARRVPLERGRLVRGVAVHAVAAVALSLARAGFMVELSRHVSWLGQRPFSALFLGSASANILFYALLLGIAHAVFYYSRYREGEHTAERLAAGLAEARLHALKMQLQPHFLFNTLNAISALIPDEAKPARRMVARLGDLLRATLDHEDTQEVTLREELAFLQPYLDIEQARLGDRLSVVMRIAPETLDARVPHLLLQPLVENAVRHGIAARIAPGTVEISASLNAEDRQLHMEIRDDGAEANRRGPDDAGNPARRGVGLANVRSRLEQLYGGAHRFVLERHPGGVVVRVSLPFRRVENVA
jgi:sensor histidine kinase YesM